MVELLDATVDAIGRDGAVVTERVGQVVEGEGQGLTRVDDEARLVHIGVPVRDLLGREVHQRHDELETVLAHLELGVELADHAVRPHRAQRTGEVVSSR